MRVTLKRKHILKVSPDASAETLLWVDLVCFAPPAAEPNPAAQRELQNAKATIVDIRERQMWVLLVVNVIRKATVYS